MSRLNGKLYPSIDPTEPIKEDEHPKKDRPGQLNIYSRDMDNTPDLILKRCLKLMFRDVQSVADTLGGASPKWRPLRDDESRKLVSYVKAMNDIIKDDQRSKGELKKKLSKMSTQEIQEQIKALLPEEDGK